ncbi:MAG: hypothetical protein LBD60_03595 [Puniceicoccales bacterium]|nr:hypothetical protein [Puniceicoccales bacterium]
MNTRKITEFIIGGVFVVGNCRASLQEATNWDAVALQEIVAIAVDRAQQPLMQKIMEIEQQQKELIENLRAQLQPENENPESVPLAAMRGLKKYIERVNDGIVERRDARGRIDATVDHILQTKGRIFIPSNVLETEWRKAKILKMLHELVKNFPRTRIADYCEGEIKEKCLDGFDDFSKNFGYMKLLLLFQCNTWNEREGKYELSPRAQHSTVREA